MGQVEMKQQKNQVVGYQEELIKLMIGSGVLRFGDFTLKSGRKAPYFINMGNFNTGAKIVSLGNCYADCIAANMVQGNITTEISTLYGPAYKGIPLAVAATVSLYEKYGKELGFSYHRKEQKDHGEGGTLVGYPLQDGDKILIVDDVITAGTAMRESLLQIQSTAAVKVEGLIVAVDRMERGKGDQLASVELYEEFGIRTFPIITVHDLIGYLAAELDHRGKPVNVEIVKRMEDYLSFKDGKTAGDTGRIVYNSDRK